jgi:hypothetical protein
LTGTGVSRLADLRKGVREGWRWNSTQNQTELKRLEQLARSR